MTEEREDSLSPQQQAELMTQVAETRDRDAFIRLFRHFAPRLKTYMRKLGADENTAEGIIQDVMLTIWRQADSYDPKRSYVSSWVFAIARNRRIDRLRRERGKTFEIDQVAHQLHQRAEQDSNLEHAETGALLQEAIESLPEEQIHLLKLAFFEDMTHKEIAESEDIPLGTVKSRLRLALSKLRRTLRGQF